MRFQVANSGVVLATLRTVAFAAVMATSLLGGPAAAAEDVTLAPGAAPPGTVIEAANIVDVCGATVEGLDFVLLYRSEGVYTGDDVVFEPGARVEHDWVPIDYRGRDGTFVVPAVPAGTYVMYLQCYETDLLQLVDGVRLTVQPTGHQHVPQTDTAMPNGTARQPTTDPVVFAVAATVAILAAGRRHLRGRPA